MSALAALALITRGKKGFLSVRSVFLGFIEKFFGLNEEQIDGLAKQRAIVSLCFESLPMAII